MNTYHYAEHKAHEADFFLQLMRSNKHKIPDFLYYLSAYLSASRSFMYVLKEESIVKESRVNPNFKIWFDNLFTNEPLLAIMKDLRNEEIHDGITQLAAGDVSSVELIEILDGRSIDRGNINLELYDPSEVDRYIQANFPNAKIMKFNRYRWKFKNFQQKLPHEGDVLKVSEELMNKLYKLLLEMSWRFPELL